ncbi:MAG: carboxypeptidase-like regulatory domain-containing protein [Fimbriiglobus sp.]
MRFTAFCIGLMGLLIVGCASEEEPRGEVSGTITTGSGVKLKGGNIKFHPANGTPVSVDIGYEGTYRITTLPVGEYSVTVETSYLPKMHKMGPISAAPPEKGKAVSKAATPPSTHVMVPKKYESKDSSGLKATVTGRPQVLDFDCP